MATKGIEWVNDYHGRASDLSNCDNDAEGFYNKLSGVKKFNYANNNAWDEDFEHMGVGTPSTGYDNLYIDNVNIAFYAGHSSKGGLFFGRADKDNGTAQPSEMKLGSKQLRWLATSSCELLKHDSDLFSRLMNIFSGLHYILGFHTVCSDTKDRGEIFASKLNNRDRVRTAWLLACVETESSSKQCAYIRADNSNSDTANDHWFGKGFVSPKPINPNYFLYLKTTC
ncbi:MAG: DUF6345 domain-containing protein [Moheibacter sp.]